jgi:acetate kinase
MKILVLNSGSSTQKISLYGVPRALPETPPEPLWEGRVTWREEETLKGSARIRTSAGEAVETEIEAASRREALEKMLAKLRDDATRVLRSPEDVEAVGHRVVHGGEAYRQATRITSEVKAAIARLSSLAPLHSHADLAGIETAENLFPKVPQVAVFDTAFHAGMPRAAAVYPGPYRWFEEGIRRFGFHGINHHYCAERAAGILGRSPESLRLITCHLGSGCSLAAVAAGRSIETTMGFTPLEGLMMGTRSGSIDPGILLHLLRRGESAEELDEILNRESGLLGLSGISDDMRKVLAARREGNARAKLAFDVYVHRLRAGIGAMLATLGGCDALVFTAGVGENSAEVRAAACEGFEFLGLKLDPRKNENVRPDEDIAAQDSRVRVLVIRAREEWAIARQCAELLRPPEC